MLSIPLIFMMIHYQLLFFTDFSRIVNVLLEYFKSSYACKNLEILPHIDHPRLSFIIQIYNTSSVPFLR